MDCGRLSVERPEHAKFAAAYPKKFGDTLRRASVVGYTLMLELAEAIKGAAAGGRDKVKYLRRVFEFKSR